VTDPALSEGAWSASLDALESLMQRQRAFLQGAGPLPDAPWVAPEHELPSALRVRALSLAAACAEIESQLHDLLQARTDRAVSPYR
jgi:hypothetical protein